MLRMLSEPLAIAGAMADERAHQDDQMHRDAFHKALIRALSDPYTISGRATAKNLEQLERNATHGKEDSFVLDARFELGKRNDAYLQAPVLPLQTADDDTRPLGMRLNPVFEKAHRIGLYSALLEELSRKEHPYVERLTSTLKLAGWLMTLPEVYRFVSKAVSKLNPEIRALVDTFKDVTSMEDGQVKIAAFVDAVVGTGNPKPPEEDIYNLLAIFACLTSERDLTDAVPAIKELFSDDPPNEAALNFAKHAQERKLCQYHGIHQIGTQEKAWLNATVALAEGEKKEAGNILKKLDTFNIYVGEPSRKNLKALLNGMKTFLAKNKDDQDKVNEWRKAWSKMADKKEVGDIDTFAYNAPLANFVDVPLVTCERVGAETFVEHFMKELKNLSTDLINDDQGILADETEVADDTIARWTPLKLNDKKDGFELTTNEDVVAAAVAEAACLEEIIARCTTTEPFKKLPGAAYLAAYAKLKQLRALKTCIDNKKDFSGPGFDLPVLRCRARIEKTDGTENKELSYYKFKAGNLTGVKLTDEEGPAKDFETRDNPLRDLGGIYLPSEEALKVSNLHNVFCDGMDAIEDLKCSAGKTKDLQDRIEKLKPSPCPDDEEDEEGAAAMVPSGSADLDVDLVNLTARKRRRDVWSDGLREAALANDKLYGFARQLGGAIGEPISEVAVVDDSKLAAESKQIREARQRAAQRAADQHADLVKSVIAQVMKDSQLTLGIGESGSFSGMNPGGSIDLSKLKVVSGALRREASELAGLGKDGETDRFFGNAVKLESLLRSGTGEMTFSDLLAQLRVAGQQLQLATQTEAGMEGITEASASIEFLSTPRNSLMLRWRPEALSAVRESYAIFQQEMRTRHGSMVRHQIAAYELIEGRDGELTTLFATLCGLKMASSRLHSSSQSAYTSQWAAVNNSKQLAVALARVCRRACHYVMNCSGMGSSRLSYHR